MLQCLAASLNAQKIEIRMTCNHVKSPIVKFIFETLFEYKGNIAVEAGQV
jgi:hypothetical protein